MSENESGEEVYEVEWIEKKRITETGAEYYIKWKGYSTFVYIRLTVFELNRSVNWTVPDRVWSTKSFS